jgi:hypothetical protein
MKTGLVMFLAVVAVVCVAVAAGIGARIDSLENTMIISVNKARDKMDYYHEREIKLRILQTQKEYYEGEALKENAQAVKEYIDARIKGCLDGITKYYGDSDKVKNDAVKISGQVDMIKRQIGMLLKLALVFQIAAAACFAGLLISKPR